MEHQGLNKPVSFYAQMKLIKCPICGFIMSNSGSSFSEAGFIPLPQYRINEFLEGFISVLLLSL